MNHSIRIAIIGGGLAVASLIHALIKFPHLDVHIFEAAAEFKEAGMAIGIARNAQAALELIGPSAARCLEQAGAVLMRGVRFMLAQGEGAGSMADEVDDIIQGKRLTSIVHRVDLLRALLADIPQDRMHASKRLQKIDQNSSITLYFTDGTTSTCDILIGADGIYSTVRKLVLGENDPASLGRDFVDIEDAREYGWARQTAFLMHNILSGETKSGLLDRWKRIVGADEIKKLFQDWPPHLRRAINELLCNQPEYEALYLWDYLKARSYVSGPICVTGDAAHSTILWQGSGGGMSIEDSLIFSTLFGRIKTRAEALTALKVYDQVRRPRTQRIVESSRATGGMLTGSDKLELKTLNSFMSRWDFIIDIDMEKHRDEALQMMDARLQENAI
ncbi:salicylate hydroxylase [Xylariaceae sp. FL0662B]|nr:salicylate hydroxylase [Xylariaceae sp. FL0662B]